MVCTTNSAASCTKTTELVPICGKLLLWLFIPHREEALATHNAALFLSVFHVWGEMVGWLLGRTDAHTYSLNFFGCKMVGKVLVSFISSIFFSSVKFSTYIRYELVRCFSKSQNFFLQLKLGHKKILLTLTEKLVKHH